MKLRGGMTLMTVVTGIPKKKKAVLRELKMGKTCWYCGRQFYVLPEMTREEQDQRAELIENLVFNKHALSDEELDYIYLSKCPQHGILHEKCDVMLHDEEEI